MERKPPVNESSVTEDEVEEEQEQEDVDDQEDNQDAVGLRVDETGSSGNSSSASTDHGSASSSSSTFRPQRKSRAAHVCRRVPWGRLLIVSDRATHLAYVVLMATARNGEVVQWECSRIVPGMTSETVLSSWSVCFSLDKTAASRTPVSGSSTMPSAGTRDGTAAWPSCRTVVRRVS